VGTSFCQAGFASTQQAQSQRFPQPRSLAIDFGISGACLERLAPTGLSGERAGRLTALEQVLALALKGFFLFQWSW